MRKMAFLALAGLSLVVIGGIKVSAQICGPLVNSGSVCAQYGYNCWNEGCLAASGTCTNGKAYNQVNETPTLYRGSCLAPVPPNPAAECTDQCDLCTDNKYFKQDGDLANCLPNRIACSIQTATPRECQ